MCTKYSICISDKWGLEHNIFIDKIIDVFETVIGQPLPDNVTDVGIEKIKQTGITLTSGARYLTDKPIINILTEIEQKKDKLIKEKQ